VGLLSIVKRRKNMGTLVVVVGLLVVVAVLVYAFVPGARDSWF